MSERPWQEWHGGPCPVSDSTIVDVRIDSLRRGIYEFLGTPAIPKPEDHYIWLHICPAGYCSASKIIAWRLHDDGQAEADAANARQDVFRRIGLGETFPAIDDPNPIREPLRRPERVR